METLQAQIVKEMKVKPEIDPKQEVEERIDFLVDYLKAHPFLKTFILGISGGQDSTLAGRLCQLAIEKYREETGDDSYRFIAIRLPYGEQFDEEDAQDAMTFIQADQQMTVNIKESTDAMTNALHQAGLLISDFNKGNIKARQRMIVQYAVAGDNAGIVIGTDHAAESVTGFYTKFGDGAADLMPLAGLNKRQGRQILAYLDSPEHLYLKVPTADLEDNKIGQADEVALGVSYDDIDDYLEGKQVSEEAARQIERHYKASRHKRQMPVTPLQGFK